MMKQIFLFFLTKYVGLTHFFDQLKITLKIARIFQLRKFTQKLINVS